MKELPKVVAGTPVGKSVPVEILRNGKKIKLVVTLGELELAEKNNLLPSKKSLASKEENFPKIGFSIQKLNNENKKKFNLKDVRTGAVITSVKENSKASDAGLAVGMVI